MTPEQETSLAIVAYHADLAARDEPISILWEQLSREEQQRYRAIAAAVIAEYKAHEPPQFLDTVKQVVAMTGFDKSGNRVAVSICTLAEVEQTVMMLITAYPEVETVMQFEIELRRRQRETSYVRTDSGFQKG